MRRHIHSRDGTITIFFGRSSEPGLVRAYTVGPRHFVAPIRDFERVLEALLEHTRAMQGEALSGSWKYTSSLHKSK